MIANKNIFLLVILMLTGINLTGQISIRGKVFNLKTNSPLSYVNIGIFSKNKGTVSNDKGEFNLNIEESELKDSLTFSMIGYKTTKKTVNYFNSKKNIYLEEENIILEEVTIRNIKRNSKILGNKKPKILLASLTFDKVEAGNELGIRVKIKKNTEIKNFNLVLLRNDYKKLKLRINFYSLKGNTPYKRINTENIIFETSLNKGILSLDLSDYNVLLEEDFFVSLESLNKLEDKDKQLIIGGRVGGKSYARKTSQATWSPIKVGFCIYLDVLQ